MVLLQFHTLFLLMTTIAKLVHSQSILSMTGRLINGHVFQPNTTCSFLGIYKIQTSFSRIITNCVQECLKLSSCRTAVFEANTKSCSLYGENAAYSGLLVTNSSGVFTTIITDRPSSNVYSLIIF